MRQHLLLEQLRALASRDRHEAHGQVHLAALQVAACRGGGDPHVDPRMAGREARQPRDQPEASEARRAGDRDLARRRAARTRAAASRRRSRLSSTARCMMRPGLRQHQRPVAPLEQRHARLRFELLDLAADGRLREEQLGTAPR
jgi:hypothetical protein